MITLYQFSSYWNLPSASPFCAKLETYLRMAKIPFEIKVVNNLRKAPKGKLPVIDDKGKKIADTSFIIDYLKVQYGDTLDAYLTNEQKAIALALQRLVEEHLYWIGVYSRWIDPIGWQVAYPAFFNKLSGLLKLFVPKMARKSLIKTLQAQGIGRHSPAEIYELGKKDIKALADFLADKAYFMGDKPSSIDATCFAFLSSSLYPPIESPLKTYIKSFKNLIDYCERMQRKYYD